MQQLTTLTTLFLKQLVRRRSLWILVAVLGVMLLVSYFVQKQIDNMMQEGARYEIATRSAASTLNNYAAQIRGFTIAFVLLVSALIAPAARKDGTAQFLLSLSIGRYQLAAAQFAALSAFLVATVFVIHGGYVYAGYPIGAVSPTQALAGWVMLLGPLWLAAAVIFSTSLSRPAMAVYGLLIVAPYLAIPLAESSFDEWSAHVPVWLSRLVDGLELLFPKAENVILWPRLGLDVRPDASPAPRWGWYLAQHLFASAFWIALGLWRYRHHDLGSRLPTK
jgi:hypothetical protein